MCNLINTHTHIDPPLGGSMRVAQNGLDDRAGLRGYVQSDKYTRPLVRINASGIE